MLQYTTQRVLRWRLTLDEFGPSFHYKPGKQNIVADALSRVPTSRMERESTRWVWNPETASPNRVYCILEEDSELAELLVENPEFADCFLEHPVFNEDGQLPFQFRMLEEYQQKCPGLQQTLQQYPDRFHVVDHGDAKLICYHQNGRDKIVLTEELLPKVVKFYHEALAHVKGMKRLAQTIKQHYHHAKIDDECRRQVQAYEEQARRQDLWRVCPSGRRDNALARSTLRLNWTLED